MRKTIIVSNRLPVKIKRTEEGLEVVPSEGGLATGLGAIYNQNGNIWMGWPGIITEDEEEKSEITEKLKAHNLIPIFLNEEDIKGFYEGFSNEVIWPICHYRPSYAVYEEENWKSYQSVNELFADSINQYIQPEDEVWIHDYQLMLLPSLLRANYENISIAYFQHIPFPSHEIFRLIPWRTQLLEGLLGADLIGFHTYDDTQYFIDSCSHILGLKTKQNSVKNNGRLTFVEAYPMGIDNLKFEALAASESVKLRAQEIKETFNSCEIILSIDRLDYSKGMLERILAYEQFLIQYPEFRKKVVYYMLVVPSRDTVLQYKILKDEIDRLVGSVNALYGSSDWTPIAYFYNSYPVEELSALYSAASICLVTPIRDGMNLVCKEFIASKKDSTGVLILSELAGAAKELIDAVQVNPCEINGVTHAIAQGLQMPEKEQRERLAASLENVSKFNVKHWVNQFMNRLHEIKEIQESELSRKIGPSTVRAMCQRYCEAEQRLFFLDYDGTLVNFFKNVDQAKPGAALLSLLRQINADPKNKVVIISGRKQQTLAEWFSEEDLILIAEHGAWTNYPEGNWHAKAGLSDAWKESCKEIMQKYVDRTPGAFIEEKSYSMAFHYRKVQKGLGSLRAHEVIDHLRYLATEFGLQLLDGDEVIELKSAEVNKGRAALTVMEDFNADFIIAIGDDSTDEDMFAALSEDMFSVKVGNKETKAKFFVEKQAEVLELLNNLLNCPNVV